jgi:hypothetical protein
MIQIDNMRNQSGLYPSRLTARENERLLTTMNLPEMIALVLRGLSRLGKPPVLAS